MKTKSRRMFLHWWGTGTWCCFPAQDAWSWHFAGISVPAGHHSMETSLFGSRLRKFKTLKLRLTETAKYYITCCTLLSCAAKSLAWRAGPITCMQISREISHCICQKLFPLVCWTKLLVGLEVHSHNPALSSGAECRGRPEFQVLLNYLTYSWGSITNYWGHSAALPSNPE